MSQRLKDKEEQKGFLYTVMGALCWGFSGTCCQYLFSNYEIDTVWLTAFRMVVGSMILLVIEAIRTKGKIFGIFQHKKDMIQLFIISIFGLLFCQYAYLAAIRYTDSGTATILQSLNVIMILVFSCIVSRKLPQKLQGITILLALTGVWLMVTNGDLSSVSISLRGLLWGLGAALGAACYSLMSPKPVRKWGSRIISGYGMLFGGLLMTFCFRTWKSTPQVDGRGMLLLMVIILIGTIGGFTLFLQGTSRIGAQKASLVGCLEPVAASISAFLWLDLSFGLPKLIGFLMILAAVSLSNLKDILKTSKVHSV